MTTPSQETVCNPNAKLSHDELTSVQNVKYVALAFPEIFKGELRI